MKIALKSLLPILLLAAAAFCTLPGCTSSKDILYFQDIDQMHPEKIEAQYEPVIMKDDKLQIIVSGPDKSVVMPYNLTLSNTTSGYAATSQVIPYLVDSRGEIDMPGLGRLLLSAISRRDFPLLSGIVFYLAFITVILYFISDIAASLADPRIRLK